ncbi:hypothetical protein JCM5350_000508 [Sporobolomyces pararoseus]
MTLPNELINHIFEYVYTSLCHHAAQRELDFPIGSKLVFSNFSLVSKTWHSLSLPFLVRHFDGKNVEAFAGFVEKYQLFRSIKSIYLNPGFKGWPHPRKFMARCRVYEGPELSAGEVAYHEHEVGVKKDIGRWSKLLEGALSTVVRVEIGSRRRIKYEIGPHYGEWHHRKGEDLGDETDYGDWETAPSLDFKRLFDECPINSQAQSLRLNLPDEPSYKYRYQGEKPDRQFASTIASLFPNLKHYTLHSHSKIVWTRRSTSALFPHLHSLRILNVWSNSLGLSQNLKPTYLSPSAATLRYLEIQISSLDGGEFNLTDLFGNLRFPLLEELYLDSQYLSCTQSDFFDRFPRIASASIPLDAMQISLASLPLLPASLRHLTLSRLYNSILPLLAQYLCREDLSKLTRLVLQSSSDFIRRAPVSTLPSFETSETPTTELATIIQICIREQVELYYSMALPEEEIDLDASVELSEDENWDFDAEDGDEFRKLWSTEKKRSHDIDEAFAKIGYWWKNHEAETKAKEAIKPFLR